MKALTFLLMLYFICTVLILGCANQLPPEGGPIDLTSPVIVSVYPDSNALFYNDHKLRFTFDRYIEESLFEESIFISPYVGALEFEWSGKVVEVTFTGTLRQNTTYVVNIGTDVKDLYRGRMRMAKAYTLAFSTGSDLDRGGVEGFVFPMKNTDAVSGIMIFAYRLDTLNPDTVNPITAQPDFITQTGKYGDFSLCHIPFGKYRILAVRDEYRNLLYDREIDEYGVPSGPLLITPDDTLQKNIFIQLAKEDTTAPLLVKAETKDQHHVIAEFSSWLLPASVALSSINIVDTLEREPLELITLYPDPSKSNTLTIVTQKQDSTKMYALIVRDVTDSSGNRINPMANTFRFQGSKIPDTLAPRLISVSVRDSMQGVDIQPEIELTFSDAIPNKTSLDFLSILDTKRESLPVEKKWLNNVLVSIKPRQELLDKTWYILRAELRELHDWAGRKCLDSTKEWHFETFDMEDMSSIDGRVRDMNTTDTAGIMYVSAIPIEGKNSHRSVAAADASGKFAFPIVAEGSYMFQAFRDRNRNDHYDAGMPYPFKYSERLSMYTDTLKVRARWPLEGVEIILK